MSMTDGELKSYQDEEVFNEDDYLSRLPPEIMFNIFDKMAGDEMESLYHVSNHIRACQNFYYKVKNNEELKGRLGYFLAAGWYETIKKTRGGTIFGDPGKNEVKADRKKFLVLVRENLLKNAKQGIDKVKFIKREVNSEALVVSNRRNKVLRLGPHIVQHTAFSVMARKKEVKYGVDLIEAMNYKVFAANRRGTFIAVRDTYGSLNLYDLTYHDNLVVLEGDYRFETMATIRLGLQQAPKYKKIAVNEEGEAVYLLKYDDLNQLVVLEVIKRLPSKIFDSQCMKLNEIDNVGQVYEFLTKDDQLFVLFKLARTPINSKACWLWFGSIDNNVMPEVNAQSQQSDRLITDATAMCLHPDKKHLLLAGEKLYKVKLKEDSKPEEDIKELGDLGLEVGELPSSLSISSNRWLVVVGTTKGRMILFSMNERFKVFEKVTLDLRAKLASEEQTGADDELKLENIYIRVDLAVIYTNTKTCSCSIDLRGTDVDLSTDTSFGEGLDDSTSYAEGFIESPLEISDISL